MIEKVMWSKRYDKCVICGTTENKHCANGMCRSCYRKEWQKENPEKIKKYKIKYYELNCEKIKKCQKISFKKYYELNCEKIKKNSKEYREENLVETRKYARKYSKNYRLENFRKIKKYKKVYLKNRRKNDLHFKLKENISSLVNSRLKKRLSSKEGKSTWNFLPYTVDELIQHLEKLFTEGMTWQNYGFYGWHIDHKIPDCKFNYKNVEDEEFQKCWDLNNLQPLWAEDNFKKGGS